ncbi:MAG TPA: hypothetical protein VH592_24280, partial [Gemmataceae bacterium]
MRRIIVTALAPLILMTGTGRSFAQSYPRYPYEYRPGNAGMMGIGPGGREAYHPQYYSAAPYYGYSSYGSPGWGMYGGYGYGPANAIPNVSGMPSMPAAAPDESYLQMPLPRASEPFTTNPNAAAIDVKVPPGPQLLFQGRPTQQEGSLRLF